LLPPFSATRADLDMFSVAMLAWSGQALVLRMSTTIAAEFYQVTYPRRTH